MYIYNIYNINIYIICNGTAGISPTKVVNMFLKILGHTHWLWDRGASSVGPLGSSERWIRRRDVVETNPRVMVHEAGF